MVTHFKVKIYLTRHATMRISDLTHALYSKGLYISSAARYLHMRVCTLERIIMKERRPTVGEYLNIGRFFEWDLSYDVNFLYSRRHKFTGQRDLLPRITELKVHGLIPSVYEWMRAKYEADTFSPKSYYNFLRTLITWEKKYKIEPFALED